VPNLWPVLEPVLAANHFWIVWDLPVILLIVVMGGVLLSYIVAPFILGKAVIDSRRGRLPGRQPDYPEPIWHQRVEERYGAVRSCDGSDCQLDVFGRPHGLRTGCRAFVYKECKGRRARVYVDGCADIERERYLAASDEEKYRLRSPQGAD